MLLLKLYLKRYFISTFFQKYSGFVYNVFDLIRQSCNFSFTFVQSKDGSYGSLSEDGNWTGLIGLLDRNEADFAINDLSVVFDRAQVCTKTSKESKKQERK